MPHDAPTVPELIDIWQESLLAVVAVCGDLTDEQWQAQTPCPGWRAGDIPAHVIDIEQLLAGLPRPEHEPDWTDLPHATSDFGRFTEVGVDARRGRSHAEVLDELMETIDVRRAQLDAVPPDAEVIGPMGNPTSMDRLLRMRTFDVWAHEQDVRAATGIEGHWDSAPARIALEQMLRALPYVWARTVAAPAGSTLHVVVTGPGLTDEVTIVADEEAKGRVGDAVADPTVTLTSPWPDFMRLACGRVDPADPGLRERITLAGDPELGESLLRELAITP